MCVRQPLEGHGVCCMWWNLVFKYPQGYSWGRQRRHSTEPESERHMRVLVVGGVAGGMSAAARLRRRAAALMPPATPPTTSTRMCRSLSGSVECLLCLPQEYPWGYLKTRFHHIQQTPWPSRGCRTHIGSIEHAPQQRPASDSKLLDAQGLPNSLF